MKRLLSVVILLNSICILLIVNAATIHSQGDLSFLQHPLYSGQFTFPWANQGVISNYISQNTLTNRLWTSSQNLLLSGVDYTPVFSSLLLPSYSLTFQSIYGLNSLNCINYDSALRWDQSSFFSSILSNGYFKITAPFTNFSLSRSSYYPQGTESFYNMYQFYKSDTYLTNQGISLFPGYIPPATPPISTPTYISFSLKSPYQAKNNLYKGQTHCHTTNSDGADSPVDLVTAYRNAGYDFIIVTDHDTVTTTPSVPGIRFIQGCEETAFTGHIGRLSCSSQTPELDAQAILDTIRADGGISVLNHPWGSSDYVNDWTIKEIERLYGYHSIEIFNGSQQAREHNAEKHWDSALSRGVFIPGVATDDCHNIAGSGFNEGWIVVYADTDSEEDIIKGIRNGNFYSSSGPDLTLSVSSSAITATTGMSSTIDFIGNNGTIVQTSPAKTTASYRVKGWERYIRVKVTRDSDKECAWSNPVIVNTKD